MWTNYSMKTGGPEDADDEKVNDNVVDSGAGAESPSEPEDQGGHLRSEVGGDGDGKEPESERPGIRTREEDAPSTLGRSTGTAALRASRTGED